MDLGHPCTRGPFHATQTIILKQDSPPEEQPGQSCPLSRWGSQNSWLSSLPLFSQLPRVPSRPPVNSPIHSLPSIPQPSSGPPMSLSWITKTACSLVFLLAEKYKWKSLSRVRLFATPQTGAHQARLSMGFFRQEYWSEWLFRSPGGLPNPWMERRSPTLQADSLLSEPPGKLPLAKVSLNWYSTEEAEPSLENGHRIVSSFYLKAAPFTQKLPLTLSIKSTVLTVACNPVLPHFQGFPHHVGFPASSCTGPSAWDPLPLLSLIVNPTHPSHLCTNVTASLWPWWFSG